MTDISETRILLLAGKGLTRLLRMVFHSAGLPRIIAVEDPRRAAELLSTEHFHAVFVEGATQHEGQPFALAARRMPALINPMIVMFAVFPEARRRDVEKARDLGVHDVICRPVSAKTVLKKLQGALDAPRPFIAAPNFFGPDRRSQARAGTIPLLERRSRTAKKTKLTTLV